MFLNYCKLLKIVFQVNIQNLCHTEHIYSPYKYKVTSNSVRVDQSKRNNSDTVNIWLDLRCICMKECYLKSVISFVKQRKLMKSSWLFCGSGVPNLWYGYLSGVRGRPPFYHLFQILHYLRRGSRGDATCKFLRSSALETKVESLWSWW